MSSGASAAIDSQRLPEGGNDKASHYSSIVSCFLICIPCRARRSSPAPLPTRNLGRKSDDGSHNRIAQRATQAVAPAGDGPGVGEAVARGGRGQPELRTVPAAIDRDRAGGPYCQCVGDTDQERRLPGVEGLRHL